MEDPPAWKNLPSFPEHCFTRLDEIHLRHDETGVIIDQQTRQIVDPTAYRFRASNQDLCRALTNVLTVYHALKSEEVPGNWLALGNSGFASVVDESDVYLCRHCLLICSPKMANLAYYKHLEEEHGILTDKKKQAVKCRGVYFKSLGTKHGYYIILTGVDWNAQDPSLAEKFRSIERKQSAVIYGMKYTPLKLRPLGEAADQTYENLLRARICASLKKATMKHFPGKHTTETDNGAINNEEPVPKTPPNTKGPSDIADDQRAINSTPAGSTSQASDNSLNTDHPRTRSRVVQRNTPITSIPSPKNAHRQKETPIGQMFEDVDSFTSQMISTLTPDFDKSIRNKDPDLVNMVNKYFDVAEPSNIDVLPTVLLKCISDELNAVDGISKKFKLTLKLGPELIFSNSDSPSPAHFQLCLRLVQNQERDWEVCITWKGHGKDGDRPLMNGMRDISFFRACEVLVIFRAMIYAFSEYFENEKAVPDRQVVGYFIQTCLKEHRCGIEKGTLIVYERLCNHVKNSSK